MADFNRHLKKNKTVVFITIFAFLYMSCFAGCSKSGGQEKTEAVASSASGISEPKEDPCGCPQEVDAPTENSGQKKPLTQEELNKAADKLDRYFQTLEELNKDIPRDAFDPQAILDKVGMNPEALFLWVRDNTYLVPYRGVLRGPIGVLMDRYGNSLDRALLLHELLRLAGQQVRLAQGKLSEKKARELLEKAQAVKKSDPSTSPDFSLQKMDGLNEEFSNRYKIDLPEFKNALAQLSKESKKSYQEISDRTNEQTDFILKAIQKYRKDEDIESINAKYAAYEDHWWVQMLKDDGWIDLDPAPFKSEFGQALIKEEETCQPDEISDDMFQWVHLRVIIEQWANGKVDEKTVLEQRLKASGLFGERIHFGHFPMNWPKDLNPLEEDDPIESLKSNLLNEKEWLPFLLIGSEKIYQSSFTRSGEVNKNPGRKSRSGVSAVAGGLFRGLAGEESKEEADKESYLLAEWVEYQALVPGSQPHTIRRPIFDLIGPALREEQKLKKPAFTELDFFKRGLSLLGEHELVIQVCHVPSEYLLHLTAKDLISNREIIMELLQKGSSLESQDLFTTLAGITPLPGPEYSLALSRYCWSQFRHLVYLGQPNIFDFVRDFKLSSDGKPKGRSRLDIISNEIEVLPGQINDPFSVRVHQGVLDTNAEALIMKSAGSIPENTGEIFTRTNAKGIDWLVLRDVRDSNWRELNLPEDVRGVIKQNLAQGYIVIVPKMTIQLEGRTFVGWWRVDPKSGHVLGIGPEGHGQAMLEHLMTIVHVGTFLFCVYESVTSESFARGGLHLMYCILVLPVTGVLNHVGLTDMILRGSTEIPFFILTTIVHIAAELGSGLLFE